MKQLYIYRVPDDQQDHRLPEKLHAELPGILAWAVRGCLDWQRNGLGNPPEVQQATASDRGDQDVLGSFLAECCVTGPTFKVRAGELYAAYRQWCEKAGEYVLTQKRLGAQLTEREFKRYPNNGVWYQGIGLRWRKRSMPVKQLNKP